jgi:hypothetical protein
MSDTLPDLPDDVRDIIEPHLDLDPTVLATIGTEIAAKREEAKAARVSSGIETTWLECEEAYDGIDDANRGEVRSGRWSKGLSPDSPVTTGRTRQNAGHKSTVYLRLTTRYVDAGVAKLCEILLPADDKAFSFSEMPVPELIDAKEDESQVLHSDMGNAPLTRPLAPGEMPPAPPPVAAAPPPGAPVAAPVASAAPGGSPVAAPAPAAAGAPPAPPRVPLTVKDLAIEKIEVARKKAKAAETRIYDWMVETQFRAEIRKVIADASRLGVGVLKGPIPTSKRVMVLKDSPDGGVDLEIKEKIVPASVWVDPWNIYPDAACGENIHEGDYVFERDSMSAKKVRELKKLPGYIGSQIDQVLKEGPNKINTKTEGRPNDEKAAERNRFDVWYFYGTLTKDEMLAISQASGGHPQMPGEPPEEMYAIVTLINDSVVRAAINPLDSGNFPYHSMPWQRRPQSWAGVGVAEQMRAPQKITNAALRALLNNAGKSAGIQLVINQAAIRPADERWEVTPDKIWFVTNDGPADVRQAMMAIEIPNATQQLTEIVTMGERFAEETTSIPLITQGQSGATTPDTFGAAQLQNNNANQLLRSIGYSFDDYITEPVVRQYYEWLLLDPDVPNEEKGEFQIDAHGSIALVERAIQDQTIGQMGQMVGNPIFGIDPKKWATEFLKSKKLDPDAFKYTEEEQAKMDAAPPAQAPAVQAAQIAADAQIKLAVMKQPIDQQNAQAEQQIAAAAHTLEVGRVQVDQQQTHLDATLKAHQMDMEHQRAMMDYATKRGISLDAAKVQLAKTTMELNTERELNATDNAIEMHKHRNPQPQMPKPAAQVPGRAGNGRAFSQAGPPQ